MSGTSSPMQLALKQKKRGRRLNRKPVYIGSAALIAVFGVIAYTYSQRAASTAAATAESATPPHGAASQAGGLFDTTQQPAEKAAQPELRQTTAQQQIPHADLGQATAPQPDAVEQARQKAWATYYANLAALEQAKADATTKAMLASTSDATASGAGSQGVQGITGINAGGGGSPGAASLPAAGVDAGAQAEKRAFQAQGGDVFGLNEELAGSVHGPKIDTIMEGTAIPGLMVGGLTSDMPGMVVGQVSENVYDTATGNDLLIPWGSRLVGSYDNSVSNGQERVGIIWQRIIFPDTSSRQIGSIEGADQGGYAGFHDLVDTHFWQKFAAATVISIAGAAAQLAQPQQSSFAAPSSTSVASGQLTQGYSQLGQEYARSGLSIPNTLEIRPGYNFTIMVAKDMPLPVYVDHRTAGVHQVHIGPMVQ